MIEFTERAVAESFDANVDWDNDTQTVRVKDLLINKLMNLPQVFCRQALWQNRSNACGLSRF